MSFSILPQLHNHQDKSGQCKIELRVLYNRMKQVLPAGLKAKPEHFADGKVINHPLAAKYNSILIKLQVELESRILDALREGPLDREGLRDVVLGKKKPRVDKTFP